MPMKKSALVNVLIIIGVLALAGILLLVNPKPKTDEETAQCIGKHAIEYVQLGCHACEQQKELFGNFYHYITVIDCFYERDACAQENIEATPTWVIGDEKIRGLQSIEKLKELTGC